MEDAGIIELFFERSEQGIRELDIKYGKACRKLSYNIVNDRQDAEECVNDAYLGAWNAIPPVKPDPLLTYICKIVRNISLNLYHRKEAAKRSSHYTIVESTYLHRRAHHHATYLCLPIGNRWHDCDFLYMPQNSRLLCQVKYCCPNTAGEYTPASH